MAVPSLNGGYSWSNIGQTEGESISGGIGRFVNNINGTTANNAFNAEEAEKARVFNSAEAAKNREWEEYMSNTAYQRAVSDMKAAGINPAMANSQGGASTPGATAASASAAHSTAAHGGLLGMIGKIASVAIGKGLAAKFGNTALKAADNHELVMAKIKHMAEQEANSASKVASESRNSLFKTVLGYAKAFGNDSSDWANALYDWSNRHR